MRIVVDYTPAVHQAAGIGRHTRGLIRALAPLVHDHQLVLLVFGRPRAGRFDDWPTGCQVRVLPVSNRWLTVTWQRLQLPLPVEWFSGPTDLYHASDFVLPPVRQARALLTVHDLSFVTVPECAEASLQAYLSRAVPRSLKQADRVLADSESTKRDLVELLGVAADRITVIYPGVEPKFQPVTEAKQLRAVRSRYGLDEHPFILGLGTLEPRKNWPVLINAWDLLRQRSNLPHRLVIAGSRGWLYEEIFEAAAACSSPHDIIFAGFVDDDDLPALYSAADVFAFPSRYEGFGIPVVEAMACGTPVVCSDNSSLPEAAGDAALLVPTGEVESLAKALQRLIEDSQLRDMLRHRGLAQARRFTWEASARRLWAVYQEILDIL